MVEVLELSGSSQSGKAQLAVAMAMGYATANPDHQVVLVSDHYLDSHSANNLRVVKTDSIRTGIRSYTLNLVVVDVEDSKLVAEIADMAKRALLTANGRLVIVKLLADKADIPDPSITMKVGFPI